MVEFIFNLQKDIQQLTPGLIDEKTLTEATATHITCQTCHDPHGNSNVASLREYSSWIRYS